MDDLIDRKALLAELSTLEPSGFECSVAGMVAIKKIKEAPAVTLNSQWIPVTERLPGFEIERVLVMINGDYILGYPKMDTDRYVNGRWVRYGDNVTHWQPLPEAPWVNFTAVT